MCRFESCSFLFCMNYSKSLISFFAVSWRSHFEHTLSPVRLTETKGSRAPLFFRNSKWCLGVFNLSVSRLVFSTSKSFSSCVCPRMRSFSLSSLVNMSWSSSASSLSSVICRSYLPIVVLSSYAASSFSSCLSAFSFFNDYKASNSDISSASFSLASISWNTLRSVESDFCISSSWSFSASFLR